MAKKRDRSGKGNDWRRVDGAIEEGGAELGASQGGVNFAGSESTLYPDRGDIEAWEEDQTTARDLFADASDEDQMQASGGHTQQLDEEQKGSKELPANNRRR